MTPKTLRPILGQEDGDGLHVASSSIHYKDGASSGECRILEPFITSLSDVMYDHAPAYTPDTSNTVKTEYEESAGLVVTNDVLSAAVARLHAVKAASDALPTIDIDMAFAERDGFSCEEMRDAWNFSDYVSFADFKTPYLFKKQIVRKELHDVMLDWNPVCGEDGEHSIKTEVPIYKIIPMYANMFTPQQKGDLVDIRIEFIRREYCGGERLVRKCNVQRLYLMQPRGWTSANDAMMTRDVPDIGYVDHHVRVATQYQGGTVSDITTEYGNSPSVIRTPLSFIYTTVEKTILFVIAFNVDRLIAYCVSDIVDRFRITSCRAIHPAENNLKEFGIMYQHGSSPLKYVQTERNGQKFNAKYIAYVGRTLPTS